MLVHMPQSLDGTDGRGWDGQGMGGEWLISRVSMHRLQLSLNLRDSPRFLATVPRPGRLYYNCIIGPGRGPDTSINTVVVVQLVTYWW